MEASTAVRYIYKKGVVFNTLFLHILFVDLLITTKIMEIKVLGPGCAKCKTTYAVIEKVIKENNLDVTLVKVDDIMEMINYNILSTPAVVIDGEVKTKGYVPSEKEVKELLGV